MWFKKKKPDISQELKEAEAYVKQELNIFEQNRAEHHKIMALSPLDTLRAYVILAEKGKR